MHPQGPADGVQGLQHRSIAGDATALLHVLQHSLLGIALYSIAEAESAATCPMRQPDALQASATAVAKLSELSNAQPG